jgi:DNA-binding response OmpR family regulator
VIVAFEDLELDLHGSSFGAPGERIRVEPQVFEVLAYLVRHLERVVSKKS